jgi:ribosomal protein S18 acetylase RimI-like enzyme
MSVKVRPIELPGDAIRFCETWWPIYADDPHWVPPLLSERKDFLDPGKNPFFRHARVQCYIASRGGTPVGTIAATLIKSAPEHERGVGFFGFFEFPDDVEVSRALFETATEWLREQGMHTMRGPYNLSPNHEFALRVEGWDTDPALLNPHNGDYYARHYDGLGLTGVRDWYAYWGDIGPVPARFARASQRFLDRHPEVEIRHLDMADWDQEIMWFWEIYNDAWEHNWGHLPIERDEALWLARGLKQMVDPDLVWWAFVDGEPAAVAIAFLDYNQVIKKMNGKMLPIGWYHWLFGRRKIDSLRLFALGVKQKYRDMPLGIPLYVAIWQAALARGVRGADGSLVVEDNAPMRSTLEKLGAHIYQTYRIYEYRLDGRGSAPDQPNSRRIASGSRPSRPKE